MQAIRSVAMLSCPVFVIVQLVDAYTFRDYAAGRFNFDQKTRS